MENRGVPQYHPPKNTLCRPHLIQQFGVTVEYLEQLHQGQRRLGLAGFVARERIDATAKQFGRFALVEGEFRAHAGDEGRINDHGLDQRSGPSQAESKASALDGQDQA